MTSLGLHDLSTPAASRQAGEVTEGQPAADTPRAQTGHFPAPPPEDASSPGRLAVPLQRALGARFEVLRPTALGGMAVIFQLRHLATGGLFVAKIMRPELCRDPALCAAFAREARIGARLAPHPNAVPVLDLDHAELAPHLSTPFLLMPYIDGDDLDQVLAARGPLGRDEALMLLAQMGSLLMFAETESIVHADIALGNIRLDRFGAYRLLDYGLARSAAELLDPMHAAAGTPAYNSPEQLDGQPLDVRSDLYSLGLVFFHALTGRPPFAATEPDELAEAHRSGRWEIPPELAGDPAIVALLRSLLATRREDRMASAFELSGAMSALGYELPSFLRSLPGSSPTPRLRRRRLQP